MWCSIGDEQSRSHVGIVGMGRIGTALARRLTGFGCRISYYNGGRAAAGADTVGASQARM